MDELNQIKIWDLGTKRLITTLNKNQRFKNLSKMSLIRNESLLLVKEKFKLRFWRLANHLEPLSYESDDLGTSKIMIVDDERAEDIYFNKKNKLLMKRPLKKDNLQLRSILKKSDYHMYKVLQNGDIFVLNQKPLTGGIGPKKFKYKLGLYPSSEMPHSNEDSPARDKRHDFDLEKEADSSERAPMRLIHDFSRFDKMTAFCLKEVLKETKGTRTCLDEEEFVERSFQFYCGTSSMECFQLGFKVQKGHQIEITDSLKCFYKCENDFGENSFKQNSFQKLVSESSIVNLTKMGVGTEALFVIIFNQIIGDKTHQILKILREERNDIDSFEINFDKRETDGRAKIANKFNVKELTPNSQERSRFLVVCQQGLLLVYSPRGSGKAEFRRAYLHRRLNMSLDVEYSKKKQVFYVPIQRTLNVFDDYLQSAIYSIHFKQNIYKILQSDKGFLLVYDKYNYHEINLENLEFERNIKMVFNDEKRPIFEQIHFPINLDLFPRHVQLALPQFNEEISKILFLSSVEDLGLSSFPFHDLKRCFDLEDYRQPILNFAEFYFSHISKSNFNDYSFGAVSPLLFAIYHNDIDLLKGLLETHRYPNKVHPQFSPLIYAFEQQSPSAIKIICDSLLSRDYEVSFSKADFLCLIKSSSKYCHRLLANFFSKPSIEYFPKMLNLNREAKIFFVEHVDQLRGEIDRFQGKKDGAKQPKEAQTRKQQANKYQDMLDSMKRKVQKEAEANKIQIDWEKEPEVLESESDTDEVLMTNPKNLGLGGKKLAGKRRISGENDAIEEATVSKVPFKFQYSFHNEHWLHFLKCYSSSNHEEFILSDWKEIIRHNWDLRRKIYLCLTLVYWFFTVCVTLSVIFYPGSSFLRTTNIICIFFFLAYEVLEIISYIVFDPRRYS